MTYNTAVAALPNVKAHWPLDEAAGAGTFEDVIGTYDMTTTGTLTQGSAGLVNDGGNAVSFNGGRGSVSPGAVADWQAGSGDFSFGLWFKTTNTTVNRCLIGGGAGSFRLVIGADGKLEILYSVIVLETATVVNTGELFFALVTRSSGTLAIYLNGATTPDASVGSNTSNTTLAAFAIGDSSAGNLPIVAEIDGVFYCKGALTGTDSQTLYQEGIGSESAIAVTTPTAFTVRQRTGATNGIGGTAGIAIAGTYDGTPTAIEASWNGGSYATIDAAPAGGTFSGTLANQPAGTGTLTVRFTNETSTSTTVGNIGIGDVVLILGQSNAAGALTSNQSYLAVGLTPTLFGNDYVWHDLTDPTDSPTGQVDAVSEDVAPAGSVWPLLATHWMAYTKAPVAFIPCAVGGVSITSWLPGADHLDRATLYGSANYRAQNSGAGGVLCALWWQGETDSTAAMSQATYHGHLSTLTAALWSDLGIPLIACKLQLCDVGTVSQENQDAINDAIEQGWGDIDHCLKGPDLSDISTMPANAYHLKSNAQAAAAASRWWADIYSRFFYIPLPWIPAVSASSVNEVGSKVLVRVGKVTYEFSDAASAHRDTEFSDDEASGITLRSVLKRAIDEAGVS